MKQEIKLSGVLLKESDKPNLNGIIYSKEALESIHKQIQENKGKIYGELGQSNLSGPSVDMSKIVSVVEDSKYEDGKLFVDVRVIKENLPMDLLQPAIRSMGTVTDNVVQDDVKITAVDLVRKDQLTDD